LPNPGGSNPGDATNRAAYYANTAAGAALRTHNKMQRITPPPIIANPPAGYYVNSTNWTFDEITLSQPIQRGSWNYMWQSVGMKWFKYIPSLELLAWIPVDEGSLGPITRHSVCLIKPS